MKPKAARTLASEVTAAPCVGTGAEPPSRTFTSARPGDRRGDHGASLGRHALRGHGGRGADIGRQIGNFVVTNKLNPKN